MNESIFTDVHTDVTDTVIAVGVEKHQIAFSQLMFGYPAPSLKLVVGYAGEVKSVESVADHGKTAAVKTVIVVCAPPLVWDTKETVCGFDHFFPQWVGVHAL